MKTTRVALAAGVLAGLSALPITTAAAATAPSGAANAAALTVKLSLAPIKNVLSTSVNGETVYQQLSSALDTLSQTLCSTAAPTCPINLDVLKDMPDTLQVAVGQANDSATLNSLATDVVAGHADSTPLYTNWESVNANLTAVLDAVNTLQSQISTALASGNIAAATSLLTNGLSAANVSGLLPVVSVAPTKILSTVAADLPGNPYSTATAVQVTGANPLNNLNVTVDPFSACAASAAEISRCSGVTGGAQTSAANTLNSAGLPGLGIVGANSADLQSLATTLKSLLNALTNAIANPSQAGSILSGAASSLPAPLAGPVGTLGGLLNQAGGAATSAAGTAGNAISVDLLKQWDTTVSTQLDSVNALISTLTDLAGLPDIAQLLTSKDDIATAKTAPTAAGGVLSTATTTLGSLSILPIGSSLSGVLNTVIGKVPALQQVSDSTALLQIDGVTSSAQAGVGSVPACSDGKFVCASSGLRTVSVLGQTLDLDNGTFNGTKLPLPSLGQEVHAVIGLGPLGSVTLDITRGLPQIVADTATYREVNVAALDVRLINGAVDCATSGCTDLTPKAVNAADQSSPNGVQALGDTGATVVETGIAAAAAKSGTTIPENVSAATVTSLPSTGMFGGGALPAGLVLIAVAISLRLVPTLRFRPRRVR